MPRHDLKTLLMVLIGALSILAFLAGAMGGLYSLGTAIGLAIAIRLIGAAIINRLLP